MRRGTLNRPGESGDLTHPRTLGHRPSLKDRGSPNQRQPAEQSAYALHVMRTR